MARETFIPKVFNAEHRGLIDRMVGICNDYRRQGFDLTLRQLYYQLVAGDVIPNTEQSYKRIGGILSDARLAGIVDWAMIVDRGRDTAVPSHWDDVEAILTSSARAYSVDPWEGQANHVEVMVEKQALEGILQPVCRRLRVPFGANKGYASSSHLYEAGQRIQAKMDEGKSVTILYLGDHDPSGIDMTRDVDDRIGMFAGFTEWDDDAKEFVPTGTYSEDQFAVKRIALNMGQIRQYGPPPNPAKLTDSRAGGYVRQYGRESWELDALEPRALADLVTAEVLALRDEDVYAATQARQESVRAIIRDLEQQSVAEFERRREEIEGL